MDHEEALDRALADLEIVEAAYADEIQLDKNHDKSSRKFPLRFTLKLGDEQNEEEDALVTLEFVTGYPTKTGVQIVSYRSRSPKNKARLDETVASIRKTSIECLDEGMEGGLACCAKAFEAWNDYHDNHPISTSDDNATDDICNDLVPSQLLSDYKWITGEPLLDKKSTFQAHICRVSSEREAKEALKQLIEGSTKIQKATHNMVSLNRTIFWLIDANNLFCGLIVSLFKLEKWAFRLIETVGNDGATVLKHDNDDDGEDAAGSRLAHLLEMRNENCVLVVVSRWYGGIKLGPKRFAHINNVARELLQHCHEKNLLGALT